METKHQLYWTTGISAVDRDQGWTRRRRQRVEGPRRLGLRGGFGRVRLEIITNGLYEDLGVARASSPRTAQHLWMGCAGATEESDRTRSAAPSDG